jgi:predicted 2-oxoglutarate/Fe(II)-dependent dioxygenase YbiX
MEQMINGIFSGKIFPTKTLAGCIEVFEDIWPDPQETINLVEEECSNPESGMNWTRAETTSHGVDQKHRTNYNLGITNTARVSGNELAKAIHNQFYFLLLATTIPYDEKYQVGNMYHEGYNMLRYSTGQEYKAHKDGETESGRALSAILYLNDEYTGGEVEFVNYGVKIKPKPGMLLLFPSNYAYSHIAHPVTSGTKYAIVTWIKDRYIP